MYPSLRDGTALAAAARHILSKEQYSADQLHKLRDEVAASSDGLVRPSTFNDIAVIRLRIAEGGLSSGQLPAEDLDALKTAIDAALDRNPTRSFLWLADYWLQGLRNGGRGADLRLIRMSYETGPNEGWIAARRNPMLAGMFASLPVDLRSMVLAEFAGLVRSGLYQDAAGVLAGPGWPIRDALLGSLAGLEEENRRQFARVLKSKDLEELADPLLGERPSRPY
jgi:hypothetical protein